MDFFIHGEGTSPFFRFNRENFTRFSHFCLKIIFIHHMAEVKYLLVVRIYIYFFTVKPHEPS